MHFHLRSECGIANVDCYTTTNRGADYRGNVSKTDVNGIECQAWNKQTPHKHGNKKFGDHNHCRNPDGEPHGPWCYTIDANERWRYCNIRRCSRCDKGKSA